jgi:hypothetical protein
MVFGGEFLMAQDAPNLRGFFDSFFHLPEALWTVSGWEGGGVHTDTPWPTLTHTAP